MLNQSLRQCERHLMTGERAVGQKQHALAGELIDPVDVVAVIAVEICVLTPEKAVLGRTVQAQIY
jgi:hypothetical protein